MSEFWLYFTLGLEHVLDLGGYDHMLFLIVLAVSFDWFRWKPLLIMVTIFTLGHTTSLFLSNYDILSVDSGWIEWLIPLSIALTALYNIKTAGLQLAHNWVLMGVTFFFGLIHGFGFGTYYNMINDDQAFMPLIEFALGIEMAQVIIVVAFLLLGGALKYVLGYDRRDWIMLVSAVVFGMTLPMLIENWPA